MSCLTTCCVAVTLLLAARSSDVEELDAFLARRYPPDEPGAAVVVVRDGEVIFREAYGLAEVELGVVLEPEMVFAIGSMTKQFTAVGIVLLADRGELFLDDPLTKYLPAYPSFGDAITIRHLLNHTSGLRNYNELESWQGQVREDVTLEEMIAMFRDAPPEFAPGERWKYCNSGYTLLGAILEEVSGQSWGEFLAENVFEPLGMKQTRVGDHTEIVPGRVQGYRNVRGRLENDPYMSFTQPNAGGALLSSVDDLVRWQQALESGELLSWDVLEQCWTPAVLNEGTATHYGFGWFVDRLLGRRNVYHGGGLHGFVSHALWLPDDGLYVAVLSNVVDPDAIPTTRDVAERVAAIVLGEPMGPRERKAIELPAEELARYAGTYLLRDEVGQEERRQILFEDGRLYYLSGSARVAIDPASRTEFFIPQAATYFSFELDDSGQVTAITVHVGGTRKIDGRRIRE